MSFVNKPNVKLHVKEKDDEHVTNAGFVWL